VTLTLIVPTFNEGGNVVLLASLVSEEMEKAGHRDFEILFVDDSTDDTPRILEGLARENPHVRFVHRAGERGLGTAIVRGFSEARGKILAVMDGDLQHPPDLLPAMLSLVLSGYDFVIPSRFIPGGNDGGLSLPRKIVSWTARWMAKILLRRVRKISDPTGGVFMFRREVIAGLVFHAGSWKILIEVLVRGHYARIAEIPYRFRARELGSSKLTAAAQADYVRHLVALFFCRDAPPAPSRPADHGKRPVTVDRIPPQAGRSVPGPPFSENSPGEGPRARGDL
jgi:dolichol-phosphate mannosyltransferase